MNDQPGTNGPSPNIDEFSRSMSEIAATSQRLITEFLARQAANETGGIGEKGGAPVDPLNVGGAFMEMTSRMMADPAKMMQANLSLWQDYVQLWQNTTARMMGHEDAGPKVEPEPGDRRFKDQAWNEDNIYDFFKQSYLLTSRWLVSAISLTERENSPLSGEGPPAPCLVPG